MKTLKSIGKALFAVVLCLNFVSCNLQWVIVEEDTDDNYITVGLNCGGEFLDISNSPLSKAAGDDLFYIQVYSLKEYEGMENSYEETPYAYGVFESSLDDVTIKLLDGAAYRFKIAIVVGGSYGGDPAMGKYNKEFNYDRNYYSDPAYNIQRTREGFYGELDKYVPVEGESVTINTKRVSYGAEFIAENLTEGIMRISVSSNYYGNNSIYTVELTPENPTSDKIYSFSDVWRAWYGMTMPTGNYDPETGNMIYEQVDYYNEKTLTVNWVKSEDNVVPLGNYKVTFQRNVKTTIRIKAEEIASSKGMSVTREDTEITLDDTEYVIEGGKVIEVPIN